jgi:cytoskeletal protein RodZ
MTIEGLGKKFQDARIARGLTLDEAARLTKIRPSRLAEIEADDFSQFPSLAYAKGFLLIYGKFLDVDVTPYLDAFETSQQVTVDGYSYLQDQPVPKPRRVRPTRPSAAVRAPRARNRSSPFPILVAIGVIVVGFVAMRLILNIERISPHQMVGVPQPTSSESPQLKPQAVAQQTAPPQAPVQTPAPTIAAVAHVAVRTPSPVAQAPSRAPSQAAVAVVEATKKTAPAALAIPTPAPSIPIPDTFVPAIVNSKPIEKPSVASKTEPEVRRAEPVKPDALAEAEAAQKPKEAQVQAQAQPQAQGPNEVAIKPLKKTYIKVVVDNGSMQPSFERWISPSDGTVEFHGQKIAVRVLDRDAIRITKNGKPISGDDEDVTVE